MVHDMNFFRTDDSLYFKKVSSKSQVHKDDECDGYLLDTKESEARRIIESLKSTHKLIAVIGGNNAFNRRALETLRIHYLVSPERGFRRDSLHQRDSGLNHVLLKEATKKKVSIIINLPEIMALPKKERALRLGRIMQNIRLCRKSKTPIKIASFASQAVEVIGNKERQAFGASLGMSSQQVNSSTVF